jgi:hypothetical protein
MSSEADEKTNIPKAPGLAGGNRHTLVGAPTLCGAEIELQPGRALCSRRSKSHFQTPPTSGTRTSPPQSKPTPWPRCAIKAQCEEGTLRFDFIAAVVGQRLEGCYPHAGLGVVPERLSSSDDSNSPAGAVIPNRAVWSRSDLEGGASTCDCPPTETRCSRDTAQASRPQEPAKSHIRQQPPPQERRYARLPRPPSEGRSSKLPASLSRASISPAAVRMVTRVNRPGPGSARGAPRSIDASMSVLLTR